MTERTDSHTVLYTQYRALLSKLPGVYAVNLLPDETGAVREIHIVASSARNPKQISRDVQSALLAAFDLSIDHRIISIAQLASNPLTADDAVHTDGLRLQCIGINSGVEAGAYRVNVHLQQADRDFKGEAVCRNTPAQRMRAVVLATLDAVHAFLDKEGVFTFVAAQSQQVGSVPVAITVLEYADKLGERLLIGAAQQGDDTAVGFVKSTLDALNRSFARAAGNA